MTRTFSCVLAALALAALPATPAAAEPDRPAAIPLPVGYQPEGIAIAGITFYVGSIPTGEVRAGDVRGGPTRPLVPPREGRAAIGLEVARGLLYVAGGRTGKAFVYDARTGADVATHTLTTAATFVNDVTLARDAAYFTDSVNPVIYKLSGGTVTPIPITGDLVYRPGFNANGIAATPDGTRLFVVQSVTGEVFGVDAATGESTRVDLGGATVPNGDGILLDGRTLYVVQNRSNLVARIDLSPGLTAGTVVSRTGHPLFDVPTTIAEHGDDLYAVNARFGTDSPETATYDVVRFTKP